MGRFDVLTEHLLGGSSPPICPCIAVWKLYQLLVDFLDTCPKILPLLAPALTVYPDVPFPFMFTSSLLENIASAFLRIALFSARFLNKWVNRPIMPPSLC